MAGDACELCGSSGHPTHLCGLQEYVSMTKVESEREGDGMDYKKVLEAFRYRLQGMRFFKALRALDYASKFHTGVRKDGVTPEFGHQVWICNYLLTLKDIEDLELLITVALLHDVSEDYDVGFEEIEAKFGKHVSWHVEHLSKKHRGVEKDTEGYYREIGMCPVCSIVKGCDRNHNVYSMVGVFTFEKQQRYLAETRERVLPMLKEARRRFPEQELAYENMKLLLKNNIRLIEEIHKAAHPAA